MLARFSLAVWFARPPTTSATVTTSAATCGNLLLLMTIVGRSAAVELLIVVTLRRIARTLSSIWRRSLLGFGACGAGFVHGLSPCTNTTIRKCHLVSMDLLLDVRATRNGASANFCLTLARMNLEQNPNAAADSAVSGNAFGASSAVVE